GNGGRRDDAQRDRLADAAVSRTVRPADAGPSLVQHQHDAEGSAARARDGSSARRAAADDGRHERMADSGAGDRPCRTGLRGSVSRAGACVRSGAVSERLLRMYRQMIAIRLFEERVNDLYTRALMPGLAHLYIGEEAVAVGVCETLRRDDYITSTHRGHGHCLAKGAAPDLLFAELLGKKAGYCTG